MLPTLKRTITKSTLHVIEGTAYLCALRRRIAPGACATSTLLCPVTVTQTEPGGTRPSLPQNRSGHTVCMTRLPNDT